MIKLVDAAFERMRVTLLLLVMIVMAGIVAFTGMPREGEPDVTLPVALIIIPLPGVSPEDAERLLVKPTEKEFQSLEGLESMDVVASEGQAQFILQFEFTRDIDEAVSDIETALDRAKVDYPEDTRQPLISQINAQSINPMISVIISGSAPERALRAKAVELKDRLLGVSGVLDAALSGDRDEVLEILVRPQTLEAYGLSIQEITAAIRNNNVLIPAGSAQFEDASYAIKIPGLAKSRLDLRSIPVRTDAQNVILLSDIATLRRTFVDPTGYTIFNGEPAIGINIDRRKGKNIIAVTEGVKEATRQLAASWPGSIKYDFIGAQSVMVESILRNLIAAVTLAVTLVMIVVVAALGLRSAALVGVAIPISFLIGLALLNAVGFPLNMLVIFAMILSVGLLVDSAIVIVEFADRQMLEGANRLDAFKNASRRMFWPLISSTATTLAAFVPFLFWQALEGEYMKYLPITLIFVLGGSTFVALIFLPLIGSFVGIPQSLKDRFGLSGKTDSESRTTLEAMKPGELTGMTGQFVGLIARLIERPITVLALSIASLMGILVLFRAVSPPVIYFPPDDQEIIFALVQARGNVSEAEKVALSTIVMDRLKTHPAVENLYLQTDPGLSFAGNVPVETIGKISIDLVDITERQHSTQMIDELRRLVGSVPGTVIEIRAPDSGPERGKDANVEISSYNFAIAQDAANRVREFMETATTRVNGKEVEVYMDLEDNRSLEGIEWSLEVDREEAGRYGVSVQQIGAMIQLVSEGLIIDTYSPDDADAELDMRLRFPRQDRTITALHSLRIQTPEGSLPLSNFVTRVPRQQIDRINRRDGRRVIDLLANGNALTPGHEVSQDVAINLMRDWLEKGGLGEIDKDVSWSLRGTSEDKEAASSFFAKAMAAAMFMIGVILLLQFNSFYHAILTLSAVVMSVFGVLFFIAIFGGSFSVLASGTGLLALAGIVVNNNIVLIDTFQNLRRAGVKVEDAVLSTVAQRLRPVLLTTCTTVLGLLPVMFELNVSFLDGSITRKSAGSNLFAYLAECIIYGLSFATILTLVFTPVMLALPNVIKERITRASAKRHLKRIPKSGIVDGSLPSTFGK